MRLIDADDILTKINKQSCDGCCNHDGLMCKACYVADNKYMIEDAPTIDPVKHGEWEKHFYYDRFLHCTKISGFYCSACKNPTLHCTPYCSSCGAKMKEVEL